MRRPQFSLKTLLWLMLTTALASVEVPRLWRAVFPRQRIIEFSAAEELDDDWCIVYTLFDDGTFERQRVPTDSLVPPAVKDDHSEAEPGLRKMYRFGASSEAELGPFLFRSATAGLVPVER